MPTFRSRTAAVLTLGAAALVALAACADAPSGPGARRAPGGQPAQGKATTDGAGTLDGATALYTAQALTRSAAVGAQKATAVIGPEGGTLTLPSSGLTVVVPRNAVRRATTFTVTAPSGTGVWYEFQPQGTKFDVPLQVTQDLRGTNYNALTTLERDAARAGYFKDGTQNTSTNTAPVYEELPVAVDVTLTRLTFQVPHFSGWMVSTGRNR